MLVHEFLRTAARMAPRKTALIYGSKRLTFGEVNHAAGTLAGFFRRGGLERGDRVVIFAGNQPETVLAMFGTLMAGGCFSVVNPGVKEPKLRKILGNAEPRFIVTTSELEATARAALTGLPGPPAVLVTDDGDSACGLPSVLAHGEPGEEPRLIDEDLASIIYTSGSTGDPKGVTMSHRNMTAASTSITGYIGNRTEDVILNMLPFSFDYGLYQVIMAMQMRATLVVEPTFAFPFQVLELIREHEVTGLPLVPTIMAILLRLEVLEHETFPSVRYITNTAAPLPPAYVPKLRRAFPNARIFSMYGLTECKRVSYLPPEQLEERPMSVGIPMPNLDVAIVDENGEEVPRGRVGELVVRGATVMRGYWRDPEGTARRLRPGKYPWEIALHTGDLFTMDDEGYLYFVARTDDIIKCRGERVHPKEIEDVLYGLEDVLHARVVGIPDEISGQAIRAEVALRDGAQLDERGIVAHCRLHLEPTLVPQVVAIVPSLSLTESGKIRRTVEDVLARGQGE